MTLTHDPTAPVHLGGGCRAYRVTVDGQHIGWVFGVIVTIERRTPGRRYVNARWESRRPRWLWRTMDGRQQPGGLAYETRAWAARDLVREVGP